jgi:hypothetical protein
MERQASRASRCFDQGISFVVRLSRWTKHGHAARMTIHRFVELAIVAA